MRASPPTDRIAYLDALRALAALAVVTGHYFAAFGAPPGVPQGVLRTPLGAVYDGEAAVSFFFVLSGFVLSVGYFRDPRRLHERFSYGGYIIARVCRLWVPFAAALLITWAVRVWLFAPIVDGPAHSAWLSGFWQQMPTVRQALTELSMVLPPQTHQLIPPGWTLTTEMSLSLLVPIAALLAERRVWWLLALGAFGVVSLGLPRYSFHFVLGVTLSRLWVMREYRLLSLTPAIRALLWIVAAFLYSYRAWAVPYLPDLVPTQRIWYVTGTGAALILALALEAPRLQRALHHPVLQVLGRCSYSIYLVHFTLLIAAVPPVVRVLANDQAVLPPWLWLGMFAAFVAATIVIALVFERWIERPSIALGRRWISGRQRSRGEAPEGAPASP